MRVEGSEERRSAGRRLLRELRSPQNARLLRAMAPFDVDETNPADFEELLSRLDEAEEEDDEAASPQAGAGHGRRLRGALHAPAIR